MDKTKSRSLDPGVVPFIPKQSANVHQEIPTQSDKSPLSPNVPEFVPSWLQKETVTCSQKDSSSNSKLTDSSSPASKPSATKKKTNVEKSGSHPNLSICQPSQATEDVKKPSSPNIKKNTKLLQPTKNQIFVSKAREGPTSDQQKDIDSEFPALGSTAEQGKRSLEKDANVGRMQNFAISFSEKLKSSNSNYPPSRNTVTVQKTTGSSTEQDWRDKKNSAKKNVNKSPMEKERIGNTQPVESSRSFGNNQEMKLSVKDAVNEPQSDDNGFHVVKNRKHYNREGDLSDQMGQVKAKSSRNVAANFNQNKNVEKQFEDRLKNSKRNSSKWFSENRNMGILNDAEGYEGQRSTYQYHLSNNRNSSDPHWRKRPEKRSDGKEQSDVKSGKRATQGQVGKPEETERDYPMLESGHPKQNGRPDKPPVRNIQTPVLQERANHNPENTKREGLKIKITLGKSNVENTLTTDTRTRATFSYSDALKCKAKVQLPEPPIVEESQRGVLRIPQEESDQNEEGSDTETKTKKKKKKKKKKKNSSETPQAVKKTKEPLLFDFGEMLLAQLEETTSKKKQVIRAGGLLPAQAPLPPKESKLVKKPKEAVSNSLDSTAPIVFHRKEREAAKKKKPSMMRKVLTKEREERKLLHDGKLLPDATLSNEDVDEECEYVDDEDSEKSTSTFPDEIKKSIHSRKFREYCDHDLDYDINGVVIQLLKELIRFQDRLYLKDPIKAKAKRRFVCGLREVFKHAKLKRLKCIVVTPNMEPTKSKGGLDDLLSNIINVCHSQSVPVVFALNRQVLGKVLLKKVPVSVVGIFYYDGAQNYFKNLMELTKVARETYREKFEAARQKFLAEKKREADENEVSNGHENAQQLTRSENDHADHSYDVGEKNKAASEVDVSLTEHEAAPSAVTNSSTSNKTDLTGQNVNVMVPKEHSQPLLIDRAVPCDTETVVSICENREDVWPDLAEAEADRDVGEIQEDFASESSSKNETTDVTIHGEATENEKGPSASQEPVQPCFADGRRSSDPRTDTCEVKAGRISDKNDPQADCAVILMTEFERKLALETVITVCENEGNSAPEVARTKTDRAVDEVGANLVLSSSETDKDNVKDGECSVDEKLEPFLADEKLCCNTSTVLYEFKDSRISDEAEPQASDSITKTEVKESPTLVTSLENKEPDIKHGETSANEKLEPFLADERVFRNPGTASSVGKADKNNIPKEMDPEMDCAVIEIETLNLVSQNSSKNEKASVSDGDAFVSVNEEIKQILADERVFGNAGTVSSVGKTGENDIPNEMDPEIDSAAIGLEGRNLVSESSTQNEKASVKDAGDALVSAGELESFVPDEIASGNGEFVSPIPELNEANSIMEEKQDSPIDDLDECGE